MTAIPSLSPADRQAALEKAKAARQKRAQIRNGVKTGELTVEEVLDMKDDEAVGRMRVSALLEALPGIGRTKAEKVMREIRIAPSRRIKGVGPRQREALLDFLKER